MTNRELDERLQHALPGYSSVFAPSPDAEHFALHALGGFSWQNQGTFIGWPHLEWRTPRRYVFSQEPQQPFCFRRSTGETITPRAMDTDAGSMPRVVWSIPGLSPWDYLPAYMIHDWDFKAHHDGLTQRTFEQVNLTLAEGIYTLMKTGIAESDWVRIEIIYRAVSSPMSRSIWDHGA